MSKGGILFGDDWDRLEASIQKVARQSGAYVTAIEIGVDDGRTACDLMAVLRKEQPDGNWRYVGIDPAAMHPRLLEWGENYRHVRRPSHQAAEYSVTGAPSFVLVDGCHCAQCVARDAFLYGRLLVPGGLLLFHDAAPGTQGLDPQGYPGNHHDVELARSRGIDVRRFLDANLLGGFRLVQKAPDAPRGGVEIYEKIG